MFHSLKSDMKTHSALEHKGGLEAADKDKCFCGGDQHQPPPNIILHYPPIIILHYPPNIILH